MKKLWKKLSLCLVLLLVLNIFVPYAASADTASAVPSLNMDGNGNYTISSVEDLNKFRGDVDKGIDYSGKKITLTQDIDISKSTVPLNSFQSTNSFNGTFDGRFHIISGYNDTRSGLISLIDKDGIVENVKVDANVVIEDASKIIASVSYGTSSGGQYGLITNEDGGTVIRCSSTGIITNKVNCVIAGIVAEAYISKGSVNGEISDCYSNVTFDNKADGKYSAMRMGICWNGQGKILKNCYFYGKFTGNDGGYSGDGNPITGLDSFQEGGEKTCAYDKDVLASGTSNQYGLGNAKKCTTEEMKQQSTYDALGFDFNKTWKIDPSVNNGYPYLNPENVDKVATKVLVDVQVSAKDKVYDPNASVDENLKTTMTAISLVPEDDQYKDLISKYNITASYDGDVTFSAATIGDVPLKIDSTKININYDANGDYKFMLGKVLTSTAKLKDDGEAGPTEAEEKQQIENAKKAENILYNKVGAKLGIEGDILEFSWQGDKSPAEGKEGSIIFGDADWGVFSSARSGYTGLKSGYYDDWFKSIQTGLKKMKEAGITPQDVKMTEWEKLVLAITSIGYDPRDIEAYDLIDIISNKNYLKASTQYFTPQYGMYALTSYNYIDYVPQDGNHITRDDLDEHIHDWAKAAVGTTGADGSTILANTVSDMWTMQSQPIAAYYNPNAKEGDKYYDVKVAMDHVFNQFSNAQTYKGSFYGGYGDDCNNAWSNAQVYMTLGMSHANIFDKKYIKNGKTVLDGVLEKFNVEKGTTVFDNTDYEPGQICRGLDSLVRSAEGRNSIFDCTDVKDSTVPVNNDVAALPAVDTITSSDKAKVDEAEALYNALSDAKKASIKQTVKDKLAAAEARVSQSEPSTIKITNVTTGSSIELGNDAKISVKAENNSGKDQDVSLIISLFDDSNKFINYVCGNQTIKDGDSTSLTDMIKIPENGIYKLKAFVWDSLEKMNPLSNIIDIPINSNK